MLSLHPPEFPWSVPACGAAFGCTRGGCFGRGGACECAAAGGDGEGGAIAWIQIAAAGGEGDASLFAGHGGECAARAGGAEAVLGA